MTQGKEDQTVRSQLCNASWDRSGCKTPCSSIANEATADGPDPHARVSMQLTPHASHHRYLLYPTNLAKSRQLAQLPFWQRRVIEDINR